ncbi:HAD family hydrolase [Flavobacterium alkalisoli]|uniref:HAD family hydrolase n=1 Tax=Flavobacterium alkalisoli TaxID=2602769 RepID=A0A5B9FXM8_9FLAO|nr:HAD family hydrolase [Flavobacterium alkalisoli]QEE50706.1 HAD family hydrolase [Flavobacterium alkalisoli]
MEKSIKSCVVTDLDDTIWDWLTMWYNSFHPYYTTIQKDFNIPENELKADFKKLHQKYNTTEVSFAFEELNTLNALNKAKITAKEGGKKSILHQYNSDKKLNLKLYDGVLESLELLKSKGVLIIGFTESNAFFTKYRIKHLGLDGLFDCIYTPLDTGVPQSVGKVYSEEYWEPQKTEIRYLSKTVKKPNSEILGIILRDFKVPFNQAIYIGDKIDRDVRMAIDAGITSVYAKYGSEIEDEKYTLLREVTHWTQEDVQREIENHEKHKNDVITPDYTLNTSFSELFNFFAFEAYRYKLDRNLLPQVINAWSDIVKVQQHFNDIALRIRNLTLTAFTFIVATLGYIIKENIFIKLFSLNLNALTIISPIGILIIWCFYFMDKFWYHKYLIGASIQASTIENKWYTVFPELGLSNSISRQSNYKFYLFPFLKNSSFKTFLSINLNSSRRFYSFYFPLIFVFLIFFISSFFFKSNFSEEKVMKNKIERLLEDNIHLEQEGIKQKKLCDSLKVENSSLIKKLEEHKTD